ncbi:MAG: hypothetical protein LQ342_002641 [Letrouitia transgressa]|nr:MAG: hypothetical protein LQ342_002641 [Letrouitia transgressa]
MTNSPLKNIPSLSHPSNASADHQLRSPKSNRGLRKLQSAHQLSTNYAASNTPSLISQQRLLHQQQQQQRTLSTSQNNSGTQGHPSSAVSSHHRTRSNSDAVLPNVIANAPISKRNIAAKKTAVPQLPHDELESMVRQGPRGDVPTSLQRLRYLVLIDGLPADGDGMSQMRIYIWLILLNAPPLSTDAYLELIRRGASPAYSKIRNDTFRTLATNPLFKRRVSEASIIRLLNAVAWKLHDIKLESLPDHARIVSANELGSPELQHASPVTKQVPAPPSLSATEGSEAGGSSDGIYVQGMNVLCAPFLYAARSEAEAFVAFHRFITRECPGYIRGAMDGVHKGVALVDRCLSMIDPKLSAYLQSKNMEAKVYAFPSVLTMCACTPPLPEVLQLWDFLFAYGPHLNILCICAQLVIMRETLLTSPSPTKVLRSLPPLQAKLVIEITVSNLRKIPPDIYEELVHHAE